MRVELINGFSSCHGFDTDEFPLLMPHIQPESAESYLCTPVRLDNERTHYIKGFRYDARSCILPKCISFFYLMTSLYTEIGY